MAESVAGFLGSLLGALLITFILTRFVNSVAQEKTNPKNAALIAFFVVAGIILLITSFTMKIGEGIIIYIPCLILWLIRDLRRARNNVIDDQGFNGQEKSNGELKTFKCTHCGQEYNPEDYRDDAPEWLCPQCFKPLSFRTNQVAQSKPGEESIKGEGNWQIKESRRAKKEIRKILGTIVITVIIATIYSIFISKEHIGKVTFGVGLATYFLWDGMKE